MSLKQVRYAVSLVAVCAAGALIGLPGASAKSVRVAVDPGKPLVSCLRFDVDDKLVCGILRVGPRGPKGATGPIGLQGIPGPLGPVGPQGIQGTVGPKGDTGVAGPTGQRGPIGPIGLTGSTGSQGAQGLTGPQGPQGTPGPPTVVQGSVIGPITQSQNAPVLTGQDSFYSIAACTQPPNTVAYGGGGIISKTGAADIITLESSFPGRLAGPGSELTPFTSGQPDNAYEAKAVVSSLSNQNSFTLRAYVICGPGT
jgi:hypothetical protein